MRRVFDDFHRVGSHLGVERSIILGSDDSPPIFLCPDGDHDTTPRTPLVDGERVLVFMPGELEAEAVVLIREDRGRRYYVAQLVGEVRDLTPVS